jgi:exonuclease I
MPQKQLTVLSCIEDERLEFELIEVRTRGRLRRLSREEQSEWDRREQAAGAFESRGSRTGAWVQRLKA